MIKIKNSKRVNRMLLFERRYLPYAAMIALLGLLVYIAISCGTPDRYPGAVPP